MIDPIKFISTKMNNSVTRLSEENRRTIYTARRRHYWQNLNNNEEPRDLQFVHEHWSGEIGCYYYRCLSCRHFIIEMQNLRIDDTYPKYLSKCICGSRALEQ